MVALTKWSFTKSNSNEVSEFQFTLKEKDAYVMLITEKIEMPIETLKKLPSIMRGMLHRI